MLPGEGLSAWITRSQENECAGDIEGQTGKANPEGAGYSKILTVSGLPLMGFPLNFFRVSRVDLQLLA